MGCTGVTVQISVSPNRTMQCRPRAVCQLAHVDASIQVRRNVVLGLCTGRACRFLLIVISDCVVVRRVACRRSLATSWNVTCPLQNVHLRLRLCASRSRCCVWSLAGSCRGGLLSEGVVRGGLFWFPMFLRSRLARYTQVKTSQPVLFWGNRLASADRCKMEILLLRNTIGLLPL